jgi:hypothetical protein
VGRLLRIQAGFMIIGKWTSVFSEYPANCRINAPPLGYRLRVDRAGDVNLIPVRVG